MVSFYTDFFVNVLSDSNWINRLFVLDRDANEDIPNYTHSNGLLNYFFGSYLFHFAREHISDENCYLVNENRIFDGDNH